MFLEAIPDTSQYMVVGYVISFLTMGIYVLSLYIRARNLRQDQQLLEELDKDNKNK
jgi:hypothetical protein